MTNEQETPEHSSVLIVSRCASAFGLSKGGVDVLAQRHATTLAQNGFGVCLVTSSDVTLSGRGRVVVVPATRFLLSRSGSPRAISMLFLANELVNVVRGTLAATWLMRRSRFGLVVANHSVSALLLKTIYPRQFVTLYVHDNLHAHRNVHGRMAKFTRYFLNDVLEYLAATAADRVFCVSEGIQVDLADLGVPYSKLTVVPPIVGELSARPSTPREVSVDSDLESYSPYVLSVGQQSGRKRFDVLIQAMTRVPKDISLVLVGDGPLHNSYVAQAEKEGVQDRVLFLQGIDDHKLQELYARANLFALVSENEGHPVTVAEAVSMGRRVLLAGPSAANWGPTGGKGVEVISELPSPEALAERLTAAVSKPPPLMAQPSTGTTEGEGATLSTNPLVALYSKLLNSR